ncbi:hypothetical protein PIB30_091534, partial [Stylosanthes scabra]|nr:hypothetical protein [Stylosanthes scabra]
ILIAQINDQDLISSLEDTLVNVDAAVPKDKKGGVGVIARDQLGHTLASSTWAIPFQLEAHEAEAYAAYLGIRFAKECCFTTRKDSEGSDDENRGGCAWFTGVGVGENRGGCAVVFAALEYAIVVSLLTCETRWPARMTPSTTANGGSWLRSECGVGRLLSSVVERNGG